MKFYYVVFIDCYLEENARTSAVRLVSGWQSCIGRVLFMLSCYEDIVMEVTGGKSNLF